MEPEKPVIKKSREINFKKMEDNSSAWEKIKTTAFLTQSFIYGLTTRQDPSVYQWKDENRNEFHNHLKQIKGKDWKTQNYLFHLETVNQYCDKNKVVMFEDELSDFKKVYKAGETTSVSKVQEQEAKIFAKNIEKFDEGTLNRNLRESRPSANLFPDGKLSFEKL